MNLIPNPSPTSRQTAVAVTSPCSSEKSAARRALGDLRAVLDSLDKVMADDKLTAQKFQNQLRDWEHLQAKAVKTIRAAASCEHRAFKRRVSGQAALSGVSLV